jgi:hypothetical protein
VETVKHRSANNATASANIRDFFKAKDGNISDLQCAAIEAIEATRVVLKVMSNNFL